MIRRHRSVTVHAEVLGEPVDGVWCEPCALPSASAAVWAIPVAGRLYAIQLVQACNDCGAEVML